MITKLIDEWSNRLHDVSASTGQKHLYKTESILESKNAEKTTVLNVLLEHDGSVTRLLESLFQEPIEIECLNQHYRDANTDEWDDIKENEKLLCRNVFLSGRESQTRYLYATSIIRTDYLDAKIVEALLMQKMGIGKIIQQYQIETYREQVELKPIDSEIMRSMFNTKGVITARTYKIIMNHVATMLITEYYPNDVYLNITEVI